MHAAKLGHGTDSFTSPKKESMLRGFGHPKNPTASAVFEPANSDFELISHVTDPMRLGAVSDKTIGTVSSLRSIELGDW